MCPMRLSKSLLPALTLGLLTVPSPGMAAESGSGWYADLQAGEARTATTFGNRHPKNFDDQATAYAVEVGRLLAPNFALQLGFSQLGDYSGGGSPCPEDVEICVDQVCPPEQLCQLVASVLTAELSAWTLAAVPRLPVTDRLAIEAKVGVMSWIADVSPLLATRSTERFSGSDLLAGLGLRYDFDSGLGLVLEHSWFAPEMRATSLGMSWRF